MKTIWSGNGKSGYLSELLKVVLVWQSEVPVLLNIGHGVHLIKPMKLIMCMLSLGMAVIVSHPRAVVSLNKHNLTNNEFQQPFSLLAYQKL